MLCAAWPVSWATWLLFTGVLAPCFVLRVRCPGPVGGCSPVCPLGALCCMCGVLGHLAPVHRCARSVLCAASAVSWAVWLLFCGVHTGCVLLCVLCHGPLYSCAPVCSPSVLCCGHRVLVHLAPVNPCARSVCCAVCCVCGVACAGLRCGARTPPSERRRSRQGLGTLRARIRLSRRRLFRSRQGLGTLRARTHLPGRRLFGSWQGLGSLPRAHSSVQTAAGIAWHLLPCSGSLRVVPALRVSGSRRQLLLGTCPCALVVAGGVPLWHASWPWWCTGQLSRRHGAFPNPRGLRPRLCWEAARGKRRPAENWAHCACRWPPPRRGRWAHSVSYPFGALQWRCPWRVPPASFLGCVRCGGWRVWTRSLARPVSRTVRRSAGDSAGSPGLFCVDANTFPCGSEDATPGSRVCVRVLAPLGRVGRAVLPGAFSCAAPFRSPLSLSALLRPLWARVASFLFLRLPLFSLFFCCFCFFFAVPFARPRCLWLSPVSGPGCLGPGRCLCAPTPLLSFFFFPSCQFAPPLSLAFSGFRPRVPWALALCAPALLSPSPPFFFPAFWAPPPASLVCVVGIPCSVLRVLSLFCVSSPTVGCSLVVAPAPPFLCLTAFVAAARCSVSLFFFLLCSCLLARRSSAVLAVCSSPPRCAHGALCRLVLLRCAPLPSGLLRGCVDVFRAACRAVVPSPAVLCAAARSVVFIRASVCVLCCAVVCCCVSCRVPGFAVRLGCSRCDLLSCFGLCCRVLCCAASWVRCCAALLPVVPPGVVLLGAVLFCLARLVPLLVVPCPLVLPVALGSCALRRCVSRCLPALCALCCVCFVVACWCVLLFDAVLCAVCVLGWRAVCSLSSPLCAVLCCAVLVRLRCAVRVVRAVAGARCCGALLCVVLFPLVL